MVGRSPMVADPLATLLQSCWPSADPRDHGNLANRVDVEVQELEFRHVGSPWKRRTGRPGCKSLKSSWKLLAKGGWIWCNAASLVCGSRPKRILFKEGHPCPEPSRRPSRNRPRPR